MRTGRTTNSQHRCLRLLTAISIIGSLGSACSAETQSISQEDVGKTNAPKDAASGSVTDSTSGADASLFDNAASDTGADADSPEDGGLTDTPIDGADDGDSTTSDGSKDASDARTDGPVFIFDSGSGDSVFSPDAACAQTSVVGSQAPLDLYIVLDMSGSMTEPGWGANDANGDCNVGQSKNSKWCYAINALSDFFNATEMAGTGVALNFFSTSVSGAACDGTVYSSAVVPVGLGYVTLPSAQFDQAMNAKIPYNGTPTYAALKGMNTFSKLSANIITGHVRANVLITDGEPTSCDTVAANNALLLDDHFKLTGVRTFVIGMTGATFSWLETVAIGGNGASHASNVGTLTNTCGNGAATCVHWNIANGQGAVLIEALKQIRRQAVTCSIAMPTTDAGIVDPSKVTLEYLPKGMTPAQSLSRVNDLAGCTTDAGAINGFYYDSNSNPKLIQLCPSTCTAAQADDKAKFNVLLGCQGS